MYLAGQAPVSATPDEVFLELYQQAIESNKAYYARYPEDIDVLWAIAIHLALAVVERFEVHDLTFEAPWSHAGKGEEKCERWIQLKAKMVAAKMRPDITQDELNAIKIASAGVDTTPEILDAIANKGKKVLCYLVGGPGAKNTYRRSASALLSPARLLVFRYLSY